MNCVVFLLGQFIFLTITEAYYETLTVKIQNDEEIIELKWKRTEQYLANENLPIWSAMKESDPDLMPDVMNQVGRFVMYHDIEHSSAVVYFENSNALFGVIDTRFYINGLPINLIGPNIYHKVGDDYVKDRNTNNNAENFHDFETELSPKIDDDEMLNMNCDHQQCRNRFEFLKPLDLTKPHNMKPNDEKLTILYPEILVFISNEIVEHVETKYPENSCAILVSQYIIYFNAVDMLFASLAKDDVKVHLNIAGIVLEDETGVFPYIYSGNSLSSLDVEEVTPNFHKYITKYKHIFVDDSVDFFFLSTKLNLHANNKILFGISNTKVDIYEVRFSSTSAVGFLGSIVQSRNAAGDYAVAAHELAHVMYVSHDPRYDVNTNNKPQCAAIMQIQANYCQNCLKWSSKSIEEFKTFARKNRNRCFLLNHPRSLYPYGRPIKTLDPFEQCNCYGYDAYYSNHCSANIVGINDCNTRIKCMRNNRQHYSWSVLPVDGTPCHKNKVCWNRQCQNLVA